MFLRRARIPVILCIVLCLSGCLAQRATHGDASGRPWLLITTEHFRVYSDLDGEEVVALAASLEEDLNIIAQAAFGSGPAAVDPTEVILFSREAHFHQYFRKSLGGVSYRAPLLPERPHTVVTVKSLGASMRRTLRHELVHDLFARKFGAAPPWLSEGFAEYFSTVERVEGDIHIGKALPDRILSRTFQPHVFARGGVNVMAVPHRMLRTPSELLAMDARDFYNERDVEDAAPQTTANYFSAWAFVHFLMDAEGECGRMFDQFLGDVKTTSVEQAWQRAFSGVSLQKLNDSFQSYLWGGRLAVSVTPYDKPRVEPTPQSRPLSSGERHLLLAKMTLMGGLSAAEKEALFSKKADAAIQSEPVPPEAHYVRGLFDRSRNRHTDAKRHFKQALRLAPNDPRFLRADLNYRLPQSPGQEERAFVEVREEFEKLAALASSPSEFFLAARFFAASGDTGRALRLGERGVSLSPVDPFVLSEYASVLESSGDLKNAVVVQRLALSFLYEQQDLQKQFREKLQQLETKARRDD